MKTPLFTLLSTVVISAFVCSCNKQESSPVSPVNPGSSTSMYSLPVTTGSYWIYEEVKLDSDFVYVSTYGVDSVYVSGDTVVNGKTYKLIKSATLSGNTVMDYTYNNKMYMDSAGYVVEPSGWFVEHDNFTDTLRVDTSNSNLYTGYYKMAHRDSVVVTPAGNFTTIDFKGHIYAVPGYPWPIPRYNHRFFANNIGEVKSICYFFNDPGYIERRLVSYHIAP